MAAAARVTPRTTPTVLLAPVEVGTGMPVLPEGCCSLLWVGAGSVVSPVARAEDSACVATVGLPAELAVVRTVGTGSPEGLAVGLEAPGVAGAPLVGFPGSEPETSGPVEGCPAGGAAPPVDMDTAQLVECTMVHTLSEYTSEPGELLAMAVLQLGRRQSLTSRSDRSKLLRSCSLGGHTIR